MFNWKKDEVSVLKKLPFIKGIDHIGYAVEDMDKAKNVFAAMGFDFTDNRVDEFRHVLVSVGEMNSAFCLEEPLNDKKKNAENSPLSSYRGGWKVELLSPIEGQKSPIDGYLSKIGNTPYHICYQVSDIEMAVTELQERGFTLISPSAPSLPLDGMVCFLYSQETGIMELIESSEC